MTKSILILCTITVIPSGAVSQVRDTAGLGAALQRLSNQNSFVRVEASGREAAGRIRELDNQDVIISRDRVPIQDIEWVQSRYSVAPSGFGRGFRIGLIGGLAASVPLRLLGEYAAESKCEWKCTIGMHVVFPAAAGLAGGMIGDLLRPNTYGWTVVWPR